MLLPRNPRFSALALDRFVRRGYHLSMTNAPAPPTGPKTTPQEKDKGYNESHGYGPGHGGPSGPGDAPSKQPATVVPTPDADDTE
jgi:hypothetical protein